MGSLGRRRPTDFEHVERYPLTVTTTPTKPVPVTIEEDDDEGPRWLSLSALSYKGGGVMHRRRRRTRT